MRQNILLIQDDPLDAAAIHEALLTPADESFHLEWVRSIAAAVERLTRQTRQSPPAMPGITAILLDLNLPDSCGIASFDRLFQTTPHIPILILSAAPEEAVARLAVRHGAQDYIAKAPIDAGLLRKALSSMVEHAVHAETLFQERTRTPVAPASIADEQPNTGPGGKITYLSPVADRTRGWPRHQAAGQFHEHVLQLRDEAADELARRPLGLALRENAAVALAPNCIWVRPNGVKLAIEDSAARHHDRGWQIRSTIKVARDVNEVRPRSVKTPRLAQHDIVTGLPNSTLLNNRLAEAISLSRRYGRKLRLLFLDVDRFRHVNQSLGHAVGDGLLQAIGQRLLSCVRSSDTVSRQGDDEFAILLPELANARDAAACVEKILGAMNDPFRVQQHDLHICVSIGLVTCPDDGVDVASLMKKADFAMYHAKYHGRGNYQFSRRDMHQRAIGHKQLEDDLREAASPEEFRVLYQPKIDLQTGAVLGVEALMRWHHAQRGLIAAAQFIPVAQESGRIVTLGRWLLREVCTQARAWQVVHASATPVAVNISAAELRATDFVASVRTILEETGLPPQCLELELTETFMVRNSRATAMVLRSLKDLGVRLALDDFGTGHASLSHLRHLPIDTLKIDRSFVRDLATDSNAASIARTVIALGTSLRIEVVAEGIETQQQLEFLQQQGCPVGQGFYFGEPLPAAEIGKVLLTAPAAELVGAARRGFT